MVSCRPSGAAGVAWRLVVRGRRHAFRTRQIELDRGAPPLLAVDPDAAAGLLGEAVDHAEAEPGAAAYSLGGEERLEHPIADVGRNAVTGIADGDHHEQPGLDLAVGGSRGFVERHVGGRNRELAAAAHGIARIDREIDDGRRKLRGIGQHAPGVGCERRLDLDVLAEHRREQLGGLRHEAVDLDLARLQRLAPCESQKLRGDRRAAHRRVVDQLGDRGKLWPVHQAFLQDLDRTGDDGQHVVQVVGDAAGELADRIHLLRLAQPLLGLMLLRQVGGRSAITQEAAVGEQKRAGH